MLKRVSLVLSVLMLVALAGNVLADDGSNGTFKTTHDGDNLIGSYTDGRINAYEVVSPVAIFYTYGPDRLTNDGSTVHDVNGIQVLTINQANGEGHEAFSVSLTDIKKAIADAAGKDVVVASGEGYTLNHSASGYYWLTGPNGYSFTWSDEEAH